MKSNDIDDVPTPIAVFGVGIVLLSIISYFIGGKKAVMIVTGLLCYLIPTVGYLILLFKNKDRSGWVVLSYLSPAFIMIQLMVLKYWLWDFLELLNSYK